MVNRYRMLLAATGMSGLLAAALPAQRRPAPSTLASFSGDTIDEATASPNGRFILLTTESHKLRMYEVANRQSWDLFTGDDIWVMNWSPKGDRISWTVATGPGTDVWVMAIDASTGKARGAPQRVTNRSSIGGVFSPDGQRIAFISYDKTQSNLSVAPATGGPEHVVVRDLESSGVVWAADGKSLYLDAAPEGGGVAKVAIESGARTLIPTPSGYSLYQGIGGGSYLILDKTHKQRASRPTDSALVIDMSGRTLGRFALPEGHVQLNAAILGDSTIAFYVRAANRSMIEVRPLAGGTARRLPLVGESNTLPVWSPDGKHIAVQAGENPRTAVVVMGPDGTSPHTYQQLTGIAFENTLKWSPDSRLLAVVHADSKEMTLIDVAAQTTRSLLKEEIGGFRWRSDGTGLLFRNRTMPGASLDHVMLNGDRRRLVDWPLPGKNLNWTFIGDTSLFLAPMLDTVASMRSLSSGSSRRVASIPAESEVRRPVASHDGRTVVGLLAHPTASYGWTTNQMIVFSLPAGTRRTIDLPFDWTTNPNANPIAFLPGESAMLVFGHKPGAENVNLYRVPLNGAEPSIVADVGVAPPGARFGASVSPDGRSVAYNVIPVPPTASIQVINLRGILPRPSR